MLYVNTKALNMEHQLDSERAILMLKTWWEKLREECLREELESCKHFLTETEMENEKHSL